MSSTSAPFGLRPAFHPSGLDRASALADGILSTYSVDILKGQPVKMATGGVIQVAAAGDAFLGAFSGVEFTDTTGRRRVSNSWPANTAYQTGSCIAYFYADQNIVYEIQADGTLGQSAVFQTFAQWGGDAGIILGVQPNTLYKIRVIAKPGA